MRKERTIPKPGDHRVFLTAEFDQYYHGTTPLNDSDENKPRGTYVLQKILAEDYATHYCLLPDVNSHLEGHKSKHTFAGNSVQVFEFAFTYSKTSPHLQIWKRCECEKNSLPQE
jgi:hypothetical protein